MLQQESLPWTQSLETRQGFIQLCHALQIVVRDQESLVELERTLAAAALRRHSGAGTVDQEIPHDLRCQRQEMCAVRQVDLRSVNQMDVRLVNQPRRVERVLLSSAQPLVRQLAQAFVNQGDELISRALVAGAPLFQETGDLR